jgi:hypothetical protein
LAKPEIHLRLWFPLSVVFWIPPLLLPCLVLLSFLVLLLMFFLFPPPEIRGSRGTSKSVPKRLSLSTSLKPGLKHSLGIPFSLRILSESCTTRLSASVSVTTWKSGKVFWELFRSLERSSYWTKRNVFLNQTFLKPRFLSLEKSFVLILRNVSLSELNLMYLFISPKT